MQGQHDRYSVRNIFEDSFTEEGTESGKAMFEGGFKFAASEARKNFDSTYSSYQGDIWERSGNDQGVIREQSGSHWGASDR